MLPSELQAAQFDAYPPEAKRLAVEHLALLRQLPLSFLPGLLRELIEYDYKFPVERARMDEELSVLSALSASQLVERFRGFAALKLSAKLERTEWVTKPGQFVEQESAYLWTTHQLDAFREAAVTYGDQLQTARAVPVLPVQRLGIAVIGQGAFSTQEPLFRALRKHGTYFTAVKPEGGLEALIATTEARAKAHPVAYGHWYVDGGTVVRPTSGLTTVSYDALSPVRDRLLTFMKTEIAKPGMGPEELRTDLARLVPAELGMKRGGDAVLDGFQVRLFTEGSGTQIFSTTFAQWTTREVLRRAEPLTLLVRYAPRQRQRPMNELLANTGNVNELDPAGSLVDGDMAAYYHWVNQQRLAGAEQSSFLVWWEGQSQAVVVAPTLPRGVSSDSPMDLHALVQLATG
ncbi:hypothetical protein GOB94_10195 [Granulicella sp. 5B5]|uniref:hypothetical protein n=1 Tax=Granulicella sp. 5B5 TaxID=1617967 RepID=UPI0015F3B272|nr:hypothetical protein [Granulicella sp. 5B5]QMV19002.1 hypothetical protein GOB94_10195 [Granulicella sp. 5B5]